MTTQEIVQKLWSLCDVLRDDGITYHQYVTELTYILFLKMAKETGAEKNIPDGYRWDDLTSKTGVGLKRFYQDLLKHLGEEGKGRIKEIYANSRTSIDEPKNLEKIIKSIDNLDWYSAKHEGLGDLYGQPHDFGKSERTAAQALGERGTVYQLHRQKHMRLRHGRFRAVQHIVHELLAVRQRYPGRVDISRLLLIDEEEVIAPGAAADVDVLADFDKPIGAKNGETAVAPRAKTAGREPVHADVAGAPVPTQHHVAEIFEFGILRMVQVANL